MLFLDFLVFFFHVSPKRRQLIMESFITISLSIGIGGEGGGGGRNLIGPRL